MSPPPLLQALSGQTLATPPLWLMRQAGRYLPEYRKLRSDAPSFIDFCLTPEMAAEATLQPLRRFGFDAAIVFADILLIPHAAGVNVQFVQNEGPQLEPVASREDIERLDWSRAAERLSPVYETLGRVRKALPAPVSLIGFAGAPWTVALYMIGGRGGDDARNAAREWAWRNPEALDALLMHLADATAEYLIAQAEAGAQVLKIFESWAEGLSEAFFERAVVKPTKRIVERVKAAQVAAPLIGFPRGSGPAGLSYAQATGVDALAMDTGVSGRWMAATAPASLPLQGGLDPAALAAGGAALDAEVDRLLAVFADRPYVFNLGHGIWRTTPIEHVERLVARIKGRNDPALTQ